jgi:hypothetical protein
LGRSGLRARSSRSLRPTLLGALGARGRAEVDGRGRLTVVGERWALDWWIGADDRWRLAASEAAVRQHTVGAAPVLETAMRVPSGDAVQRAYGIGGPGGLVVVEVENASPAAFVVAFTLHGARAVEVAASGTRAHVDGRPALVFPTGPPRWTVGTEPLTPETIGASTGPVAGARDRRGRLEAAFLSPLSHRSRLRIAVVTSGDDPGPVELARAASAGEAAAGWRALLDHGMRVVLPDTGLQDAVDVARSQVLLDPDPGASVTAALEDWGHDAEAMWAWRGLSLGARRRARRREVADESQPAGLLAAVRRMLVADRESGIEIAPGLPGEWRGHDLEVHDAPTRAGRVSYAVRWHGPRPALLWEVVDPAPGLTLRAPALDPAWSTTAPTGETLLA